MTDKRPPAASSKLNERCLVCGKEKPSGHVQVWREHHGLFVGRVCSSHTLWEVIRTSKLEVTIELVEDEGS